MIELKNLPDDIRYWENRIRTSSFSLDDWDTTFKSISFCHAVNRVRDAQDTLPYVEFFSRYREHIVFDKVFEFIDDDDKFEEYAPNVVAFVINANLVGEAQRVARRIVETNHRQAEAFSKFQKFFAEVLDLRVWQPIRSVKTQTMHR